MSRLFKLPNLILKDYLILASFPGTQEFWKNLSESFERTFDFVLYVCLAMGIPFNELTLLWHLI